MSKLRSKRWKRFVYLPDPHGHHVHRPSWEVVKQFVQDYLPDRVIYGGDVFDLSPIRRGASAEEKAQSMQPDFDAGMQLFYDVPPTDFVQGNHDYRAWNVAKNDPGPIGDFCRHLVQQIEAWAKAENVALYPYRANVFCPVGSRLKAMHGNIAQMHSAYSMAQMYGCVLFGHIHRQEYARARALDVREAWSCGCLSEIYQPYNETGTAVLRHAHGFAFGEYDTQSDLYAVYMASEMEDGRWLIPTATKLYGKAKR